MNDYFLIFVCLATGAGAGFVAGLLGVGGGIVFIPVLHILLPQLGVPNQYVTHVSIATSLLAGTFASGSSFVHHFRNGNVKVRFGLLISVGSVLTAPFMPAIVLVIPHEILKRILLVIFILIALKMFFEKNHSAHNRLLLDKKYLLIAGIFVGAFSSITGLGGGVLIIPVLLYLFGLEMKDVIGTSSLAVAITMLASAISFAVVSKNVPGTGQFGYLNLTAGFSLGAASIIGSYFGAKSASKFPVTVIKKIFSVFLIIVVIRIFFFE